MFPFLVRSAAHEFRSTNEQSGVGIGMKNIGSRRGWFVPPFYRLPGLPNFGPTHLGIPARTATGNFCHDNTATLLHHLIPRHRGHLSSPSNPPPIYSRCAERPGVQFLCLEEFLETLLSFDQGGRDFPWPTTPTAKREPRQRGRTSGRVGSRLYRWAYYPRVLLLICSHVLFLVAYVPFINYLNT